MAGYWPCSFFAAFLWAEKNEANIQLFGLTSLGNKGFII